MLLNQFFPTARPIAQQGVQPQGPTLLTTSELRQVSGGSPKGGWESESVTASGTTTNAEEGSPKGGW